MNTTATVSRPSLTEAQMEQERVCRWGQHAPLKDAFLLSRVPGMGNVIHKVINVGPTDNAAATPAIKIEHPFTLTIVEIRPGDGGGLHAHTTEEVFFPLDGELTVFWGEAGEHSVILKPWDTLSVPVNEMRGFKNHTDRLVHLLAIVGGDNAATKGSITYHPDLMKEIAKTGLHLNEEGRMDVP